MPAPTAKQLTERKHQERRRQTRSLLLLALAILLFSLLRSGTHIIFTPGWWRLW